MFSAEDQSTAVLRLDEITHGDPDAAISRQGTLVPKKAEGGISNDRQLFKSWLDQLVIEAEAQTQLVPQHSIAPRLSYDERYCQRHSVHLSRSVYSQFLSAFTSKPCDRRRMMTRRLS